MLLSILFLSLFYCITTVRSAATRVPIHRNDNDATGVDALISFYNKYNATSVGPSPIRLNEKGVLVRRQQDGSDIPTNTQHSDLFYTSPVLIGTPGQLLNVTFDTGSADFWVWSSRLTTSQLNLAKTRGTPFYDPSKSSSSQNLTGSSWYIHYADDSSASGTVVTDVLRLGDINVENQAIEVATVLSYDMTSLSQQQSQGILGLAFGILNQIQPVPQKTPLDNMVVQEDIPQDQALVSCYLGSYKDVNDPDHGQSFFTFGEVDQEVVQSTGKQITYTPVNTTNGHWQFESESMTINGNMTMLPGNTAIADTGTTLMFIDDDLVTQIYSTIPGASYSAAEGVWVFPASTTADKLPTVGFAVGGTEIIIEKEHLAYKPIKDTGYVYGGIQGRGSSRYNIFGDTFLKCVYAVFDAGNKQFGVVQRVDPTQNIAG